MPGPQGATGQRGPAGQRGSRWFTHAGGHASYSWAGITLQSGDMFMNTANSQIFNYNGAAWTLIGTLTGIRGLQGPQGAVGPQGPQGATGPQGEQGLQGNVGAAGPTGALGPKGDAGNRIYHHTAAPPAAGDAYWSAYGNPTLQRGDILIDTSLGDLHWYSGSAWSKLVNLRQGPQGPAGPTGPQGAVGATGPQGQRGMGWHFGANDVPTPPSPVAGDLYFNYQSFDVYAYQSDPNGGMIWNRVTSLRGPQGAAGPQGPQGEIGPQGATGATGAAGSTGAAGAPGNQWYHGAGDPTSNPPTARGGGFRTGDMYFDTSNYRIWSRNGSAWTQIASLVVNAQP